jgi:hypothetical protein
MAGLNNIMCDDQMMLSIDNGLNIIANDTLAASAGGHGARIRIRHRDLFVRLSTSALIHAFQAIHLIFEFCDFFL